MRRVSLILGAAIHRLLEHLPPEIVRGQLTLEDGGALAQCGDDRSERSEHIVKVASVVNILCLVSDLKARITHAEMHGVHVNLARVGLVLSGLEGCVDVLVDRRQDFDFLFSAFTDGLRET